MDDDLQLINEVKNHNDDAFSKLLDRYRNLIYKVANTFRLEQGDYLIDIDSLFQEGSIALYNVCFTFEEDKGTKFSTYLYKVLYLRMSTYIRQNCDYIKNNHISIDNVDNNNYKIIMNSLRVCEDPLAYHREQEFEDYLNEFVKNLKDVDRQIVELRRKDYTYRQISAKLNISPKNIDNRLAHLRKRLKRYLHDF